MSQYRYDLDSENPYLQALLETLRPELRAAFDHYLVAGEIPPDLTYVQLGPLLLGTVQAANAFVGERDLLTLEEPEASVVIALTRFENLLVDKRRMLRLELRPDSDVARINAWVEALPPNPSREEQERLYRKIVLGLDE